jgi:UDP-N-acetylglucosamine 2-epimerase (non-hydrolysing)
VQRRLPIVFPVHPRTAGRLSAMLLEGRLQRAGVKLLEPLSYVRFMSLVTGAAAAITDSGGIQEETTYLGIPCLTLRENTERPATIAEGTNRLVKPETLLLELERALSGPRAVRCPELWDGCTAARCVEDLRRRSAPARLSVAERDAAELVRTYGGGERRRATGSSYRRSS